MNRSVAYDAEDVVDTFMLKIGATPKSGGVLSLIKRKALMVKNLRHLRKVGEEIQAKLKAISASTVTYGIKELPDDKPSSSVAPLRNYYPHVQDEDVTGLEEHTKTLLAELSKDEERLCVVSIVGVGGLGKTTLAKKIFKHDTVMRDFDCHALVFYISTAQHKRCLIRNYRKREGSIHGAFPDGKRGSKILLTTRKRGVALQADPWSLHLEPELLDEEDSWELLRKKALSKTTRDTNCYPAGLEKLGKEMVLKCGGPPLAICVLGGILATKREDIKEWEYVHRNVASNINEGKNGGVMGILALSYNDLPVHLKPCFLYLGLFPKNCAIPRKKLIRLWIAEGFIPHTKDDEHGTLEEAGKRQYYAELIQRCMIQADKDPTPGQGKTCRMHDLMRDFCLSKGKELNFLDIYNQRIDGTTSGNDTSFGVDFDFNNSASALRTLLVHPPIYIGPLMKYQHIKLLRVLDLGDLQLKKNELKIVFELIHLRYLEIGGVNNSDKIPSSIGNLRNLQTLKLDGGILPETIENLVQLRHIESNQGCVINKYLQIENFINLQTLNGVDAGEWIRKGCFGKLSELQNLSVLFTSRAETDVLIHEISNRKSSSSSSIDDQYQNPIKVLEIKSMDGFDNQIFDSLSCCHNLHRLVLFGKLDGGLNLHKYPPNLSKLTLWEEMECSTKGFPQLQVLHIRWMDQLKKWTIHQGGMPCLKELNLSWLEELSMLPEGLRFITTLKKLTIWIIPTIKERVVREVGEDWYKVKNIPSLKVK
ncbi:hypothetical protein MKX03_012804 [Papaver bracteatum]|nr:hypothetical protein MKX03_012804 [Papaver bracteatum]